MKAGVHPTLHGEKRLQIICFKIYISAITFGGWSFEIHQSIFKAITNSETSMFFSKEKDFPG
jgi:hypothetical protein